MELAEMSEMDDSGHANVFEDTMSPGEYNALEETAYWLRSPANAERLIKSIGNLRA